MVADSKIESQGKKAFEARFKKQTAVKWHRKKPQAQTSVNPEQ